MNAAAVKQIEPAWVFACLAWAVACAIAWRSRGTLLSGRLRLVLAGAGGCLAASLLADWLAGFAPLEDRPFVYGAELALQAAGWLALAEFGRRRLAASARVALKAWWLLLSPALAALSGALGVHAVVDEPSVDDFLSGLAAAFCYLLGAPAALLAAAAFAQASRPVSSKARRGAIAAAIAMLCYGLANLLLPPPAAFFPADWLNREAFYVATSVPAAWLSGLCASALASGLWIARSSQQTVHATPPRKMLNQVGVPAGLAALAVITLAIGAAQRHDVLGQAMLHLSDQPECSTEKADFSYERQTSRPSEPAPSAFAPFPDAHSPRLLDTADPLPAEGESPQLQGAGDRLKMGLPLLIILFLLTGVLCGLGAWASRPQQPPKQLRRRTGPADIDSPAEVLDRRPQTVVPQSPIE